MNAVQIIGNLTRDPELRHTPSGTAVCSLRIAVNDRQKRNEEWVEVPFYFDVTVWGKQGENCAQWLTKGKKIGVSGKLAWREWEAQDGSKRQAVEIVAAQFGGVDFLTPKSGDGYGSGSGPVPEHPFGPETDFAPEPTPGGEEGIPFVYIDRG